ncbi:MAG: DUF2760 domain-containing protein [Chlamydiales bacterium]|nr:DUF2760 domain-containing protein [Chlamydiales bacterium]
MRIIRAFKAFFEALKKEEAAPQIPPSSTDPAHLRLLALLQKEGRLIDFFKEDISSYTDAQVGAAVRNIHLKCQESLEEFVTLRPLFTEEEGTMVTIPQGYDPLAVKITGQVKGEPPYQGILRHKGWKAHKESLPKQIHPGDRSVVYPAEVEIR